MDPQLKAIETIDKNVAVNAGAGTGKTKVLTERFINILENGNLEVGNEVESIVAITFTKKATQEMVDRIRKEIRKNFHKDPKWRRFYRDMEKSNISTIHSFCGKILRENPIEAKIDPLFEVVEANASKKLLEGSILEVLEFKLENNHNVFKMMRLFKENRLESFVSDLYSIYNSIRTIGIDFEELKNLTIRHLEELSVEQEDIDEIKKIIIYLMGKVSKTSNLYKLRNDPVWINFNEDKYEEEKTFEILQYISGKLGTSKFETDSFNRLREIIGKVMLVKDKENIWLYNTVLDLLIEIDNNYLSKKREEGFLDYDDLQIELLKLLDIDHIRKKYQNKFKYIMIDEFQDTNELQKKIFYRLCSEKEVLDKSNLFIVGDPKQSIYGFRGADIDVFYDVMKDVKLSTNDEPITLYINYRTVGTVLDFINHVFQNLMDDKYNPLTNHIVSDNVIDVEILENPELDKNPELSQSEQSSYYEADLIAKRIKSLVNNGQFMYKDFALLFRASTRNFIYEEALKNYNIPFHNSSSKRFFFRQEVIDLINGLKTISNPYDDIATIGFLRSPMIGLSDITIYYLLRQKELNIYNTIVKYYGDLEIPLEEKAKLKECKNLLQKLYHIKDLYSISHIVENLIHDTCFMETSLLRNGGKQAIANIYKFMEIANKFQSEDNRSLEDFIDYLEEVKSMDESEGGMESENSNVVKLLTIHGSKGLQFPVVIVPEMAKAFPGGSPNILLNKDIGIGIKAGTSQGKYDFIREELKIKEEEERQRVLYVAMTRAEKMLILGNQGKNAGFKGLVKDFLDENQLRLISDIDLSPQSYIPVKTIDNQLLNNERPEEKVNIPLLYDLPNYNKRTIDRFSISQYLTFTQCERMFYFDYYEKLKIDFNDFIPSLQELETPIAKDKELLSGADKGNIIHRFCELYNSSLDTKTLLEDIVTSYGLNLSHELYTTLNPYITNYLNYYREDYDKVYFERPFYLKLGDKYLTGIIDRINIKDNLVEILDIKTNRLINKEKLINHYKPQLQLYAYVVEKILKKNIHKTSILFLENGEKVDIPIDEESLNKNIYNILQFINFVDSNSKLNDYVKSSYCYEYCAHKWICELEEEDNNE